jgi:hypothetical protein
VVAAAGSLVLPAGPVSGAAGCSSGGPCVVVHQWINGTDTPVRELSAADIASEEDVATGNGAICYHTRAVAGEKEGGCHNVSDALSIHTLLADTPDQNSPGHTLGDDATFTQTVRPGDGSRSQLTHDELAGSAQSPFEDSLLPVVHTLVDAGGPVEYVRPLLNNDDQDVNANDIFSTANANDALSIYVFTGQMLTVSVTANHPHVKVGKPVTFTGTATTASTGDTVPPGSLTYSWTFGDGTTATTTTKRVTHTYPPGDATYFAQLSASGKTDGSGGSSHPLQITVGNPGTHTPPPTQSPKPGPVTSKTPSPSPSPGPVTSQTPHPGTDPSPSPSPGAGTKPPKLPGFGKLPASLAARLKEMLSGQPPQVANGTAGLPTVSGQLVGAGTPLSVSQAASAASTLGSVPADDKTTRWSPGVVPIYIAVVLLLLAVGIGRERGWRRPRRR